MNLNNFEVVNPHVKHPQIKVMERIITLNEDMKEWLGEDYVTVRINYSEKQIALIRENLAILPAESIKPIAKENSSQLRINSVSLTRTIRKLFGISKGVLTLKGVVQGDYNIFE